MSSGSMSPLSSSSTPPEFEEYTAKAIVYELALQTSEPYPGRLSHIQYYQSEMVELFKKLAGSDKTTPADVLSCFDQAGERRHEIEMSFGRHKTAKFGLSRTVSDNENIVRYTPLKGSTNQLHSQKIKALMLPIMYEMVNTKRTSYSCEQDMLKFQLHFHNPALLFAAGMVNGNPELLEDQELTNKLVLALNKYNIGPEDLKNKMRELYPDLSKDLVGVEDLLDISVIISKTLKMFDIRKEAVSLIVGTVSIKIDGLWVKATRYIGWTDDVSELNNAAIATFQRNCRWLTLLHTPIENRPAFVKKSSEVALEVLNSKDHQLAIQKLRVLEVLLSHGGNHDTLWTRGNDITNKDLILTPLAKACGIKDHQPRSDLEVYSDLPLPSRMQAVKEVEKEKASTA